MLRNRDRNLLQVKSKMRKKYDMTGESFGYLMLPNEQSEEFLRNEQMFLLAEYAAMKGAYQKNLKAFEENIKNLNKNFAFLQNKYCYSISDK